MALCFGVERSEVDQGRRLPRPLALEGRPVQDEDGLHCALRLPFGHAGRHEVHTLGIGFIASEWSL